MFSEVIEVEQWFKMGLENLSFIKKIDMEDRNHKKIHLGVRFNEPVHRILLLMLFIASW